MIFDKIKIKLKKRLEAEIYCRSEILYSKILKQLPERHGTKEKSNVIISLTSYPDRFNQIYLCLKSLMYQTVKPQKIILWLGSDSKNFPITPEMEKLKKYGLEIVYRDENLKPHNKYYYAFKEFPESIVITADDDLIYSPFTVSSLLKGHKKYPDAVCARRVHSIRFEEGKIAKYNSWDNECKTKKDPSFKLVATGCGGVLYPPHSVNERVLDKKAIFENALNQDDLWLKFMETIQGTKVYWCKCM